MIGTTTTAASAIPRPASSAPDGPVLEGRATAVLILTEQGADVGNSDAPAGLLKQVRRNRRREGDRRRQDHRQDPAVAKEREPDRAKQRAGCIEDVTGLAGVQAECLEAVVQVLQVRPRDRRPLAPSPE